MITENLSTLKIHKLTQKQYDRELAAGRIDENSLYLTEKTGIKNTASGEIITLTDVSPLEHNIGVKLASKNVLDVGTVTTNLSVQKNADGSFTQTIADTREHFQTKFQAFKDSAFVGYIAQPLNVFEPCVWSCTFVKDDTFNTIRFGHNGSANDLIAHIPVGHLPNGTYTFSALLANVTQGSFAWQDMQIELGTTATAYTPFLPAEDGKGGVYIKGIQEHQTEEPVLENAVTYTLESWVYDDSGVLTMVFDKNGSCQISTNGLGYVPEELQTGTKLYYDAEADSLHYWVNCISSVTLMLLTDSDSEPITYHANADGTVDGVTSLYPTTTLLTDTEGVTITAEDIKNVNEALGVEPSDDDASSLVVGANITDVLRYTKQNLTNEQKAQIIENLGLTEYIQSVVQNYLDTVVASE